MDFDTAVKLNIYETIARTTQAPSSLECPGDPVLPIEKLPDRSAQYPKRPSGSDADS
jgi:hypothetical protein